MRPERDEERDPFARQLLGGALLGAVAWLVLFVFEIQPQSGHATIERVFLLAPLVIVPLGLRLAASSPVSSPARPEASGSRSLPYRAACFLLPISAAAAVASMLCAPGTNAAFLAACWFAYTCVVAAAGVARFARRRSFALEELCVDVALVYLPIGGAWLFLTRLGARPLGFSAEIVALTAVHFHYAGFAAPIIAGMAGRVLPESGPARTLYRFGAGATALCPIVIAIGISVSPLTEVVASIVLSTALLALSLLVALRVAPTIQPRLAGLLFVTCAAALTWTMALACVWAVGKYRGTEWIDIPHMVEMHGVANALGFALAGLVGWNLAAPKPRS
jgi:hypothetical protein